MTEERVTYTPAQAAKAIGIGRTKLWKAVKAGELPTFKWLGMTMLRAEDVLAARNLAYDARRRAPAAPPAPGRRPPPGRRRNTSPTPP